MSDDDLNNLTENAINELGYTGTGLLPSVSSTVRKEAESLGISSALSLKKQLEKIIEGSRQFVCKVNPFILPDNLTLEQRKNYPMKIKRKLKNQFNDQSTNELSCILEDETMTFKVKSYSEWKPQ